MKTCQTFVIKKEVKQEGKWNKKRDKENGT
jgi:hypothetical protein